MKTGKPTWEPHKGDGGGEGRGDGRGGEGEGGTVSPYVPVPCRVQNDLRQDLFKPIKAPVLEPLNSKSKFKAVSLNLNPTPAPQNLKARNGFKH